MRRQRGHDGIGDFLAAKRRFEEPRHDAPSMRSDGGAPATSSRSLADRSTTCSSHQRRRAVWASCRSRGANASGVRSGQADGVLRRTWNGRVQLGDQRVEIVGVAHVFTGRDARHARRRSPVPRRERRVEESRQRNDLSKDRKQRAVELRAGRKRSRELTAGEELAVLQELGCLVIL